MNPFRSAACHSLRRSLRTCRGYLLSLQLEATEPKHRGPDRTEPSPPVRAALSRPDSRPIATHTGERPLLSLAFGTRV
jgi:hypothetical protein